MANAKISDNSVFIPETLDVRNIDGIAGYNGSANTKITGSFLAQSVVNESGSGIGTNNGGNINSRVAYYGVGNPSDTLAGSEGFQYYGANSTNSTSASLQLGVAGGTQYDVGNLILKGNYIAGNFQPELNFQFGAAPGPFKTFKITTQSNGANQNWLLPTSLPTTGQVLKASGVSTNDVTLGWAADAGADIGIETVLQNDNNAAGQKIIFTNPNLANEEFVITYNPPTTGLGAGSNIYAGDGNGTGSLRFEVERLMDFNTQQGGIMQLFDNGTQQEFLINANAKIRFGAFTGGSIPFFDNIDLTQDNDNFFFDATNIRLGIGTKTPTDTLEVNGGARITDLAGTGNRMVITDADGDLSSQSIPSAGIGGSGTALKVPIFSNTTTLTDSVISQTTIGGDPILTLESSDIRIKEKISHSETPSADTFIGFTADGKFEVTTDGSEAILCGTAGEVELKQSGVTVAKTIDHGLELSGDGEVNGLAGKLRINCNQNNHHVDILGPDHASNSAVSYIMQLPNKIATEPAYSTGGRILEINATGEGQWIDTPTASGGGGIDFSGLNIASIKADLTDPTQSQYGTAITVTAGANIANGEIVIWDYSNGTVRAQTPGSLPSQNQIIGVAIQNINAGNNGKVLIYGYATVRSTYTNQLAFLNETNTLNISQASSGASVALPTTSGDFITFKETATGNSQSTSCVFDAGAGNTVKMQIVGFNFDGASTPYDRLQILVGSQTQSGIVYTPAALTPGITGSTGDAANNGWKVFPNFFGSSTDTNGPLASGNAFPSDPGRSADQQTGPVAGDEFDLGQRFAKFDFKSDGSVSSSFELKIASIGGVDVTNTSPGEGIYLDPTDFEKGTNNNSTNRFIGTAAGGEFANNAIVILVAPPRV